MNRYRAGISRLWIGLAILPVVAFLAACGGAGANRTASTVEAGTVQVQLVWPDGIPPAITTVNVTITVGKFQATQSQPIGAWANSIQTVTTPPGTGTLQVDALNGRGVDLFSGTAKDITVSANTNTLVLIFLYPLHVLDAPESIEITPAMASIAAGTTQQYVAKGTYLDGTTRILTSTVNWGSDNAGAASIDSAGVATGIAIGAAKITATFSSATKTVTSNTAVLNVSPAFATSLQITPAGASIPLGTTQQYTAVATFSDKTTQDVTALSTWSFDSAAASVSSSGLATGVATGTTTINATFTDATGTTVSGTATLTVTPAILLSIQVNPTSASVPAGTAQQFKATGLYTDGPRDVTAVAIWSSDNATVATVSASGLAKGLAQGTANIAASIDTVTSPAAVLTVTPAKLVSIQATPATASIAAGTTQQYTAVGTYTDDTTKDITGLVSWGSSDASFATIDMGGLATGVAAGGVSITAIAEGVTSNVALLTVTPAVVKSIQVSPPVKSIAKGTTQQYVAIGTYTDNNTQDISSKVSWNSSDTSVATIGMGGQATGVKMGATTITANLGTVTSNSAILAVTAATLTRIQVSPALASIASGTSLQFAATGVFTDNSTQDLTLAAAWNSDATGVATITDPGLVRGVGQGTANITASVGALTSNTASLTVTAATLVSIQVSPGTASIAEGTTQQFTAVGTYSDGSTQTISLSAAWGSSNTGVATIGTSGLATGVEEGTANITASMAGVMSPPAVLSVTPETLVSIQVSPAAASIAAGTKQQYVATGTYSNGSTQTITKLVAWGSSDTSLATISTSGVATGVAAGTVTVSASLGAVPSGTATLTVTAATLSSIQVTPASASIAKCATQQFTATGTYSDGSTQDVTQVSSWISSNTGVATISSTGLAKGADTGSTNITATYGGATFTASLTVTSASVCDHDSVGDEHGRGDGDDRNGRGDGDDHSRRGDDRHRDR